MIDKIERRGKGVYCFMSGLITSKEITELNDILIEMLKDDPYEFQFCHFYDIEDFVLSTYEMREAAHRDVRVFNEHPVKKVAIVSDSPLVFGMARMYESFAHKSSAETRVFKDLKEAEIWVAD